MVRNYKKKSDRATKYTQDDLNHAVAEIKRGVFSIYRAHKLFNIPKTTLFYHVTGARGVKSKSQGRAPTIPLEQETRLAEGLKTMERWGFGISRLEVLEIVREFVITNEIKTPFKNNIPSDEWFASFKKRHNLSVKKPQAVEYARKKMTDPFFVQEYFDILKDTLVELKLEEKPDLIWNMDETSITHDPKKTKVVGARGKPSSRTTSGPGRENTTVLSAVSASGTKAPPLIIFKGKNIWDSWLPDNQNSFPGTAYAASPNGWMESDIFHNYFQKTFIPVLGPNRPVLLVYDGHSTHISIALVELARANDITIIKLPPHTSHILQPLDLAVFKSVKDIWDQKLVTWQRHNTGIRIPKKEFSQMIGATWKNVNAEIIKSGFKKAGIHPFNRHVIPEEKYHPESLRRFKEQQALKNHSIVVDENRTPNIDAITSENAQVTDDDQSIQNQATNIFDAVPSTSKLSFEELLLSTEKQTNKESLSATKRKRVATGAEVVTSEVVLNRLAEENIAKELKQKEKQKRHEKAKAKREIQKRKKVRQIQESFSSSNSEEEMEEPSYVDSEDDIDPEQWEEEGVAVEEEEEQVVEYEAELGKFQMAVGRWAAVEYTSKTNVKHFIGKLESRNENEWKIRFLRYKQSSNYFFWPEIEDTDMIVEGDIVKMFPEPIRDRRNHFIFKSNFEGLNL